MATFIMLVGLPGAGKSTLSKKLVATDYPNAHIHASDDIREEVFGTALDQREPEKIFGIMRRRTVEDLTNGIDVIYDATNIRRKERRRILRETGAIPGTHRIAIVVRPDVETAVARNLSRSRKVPPEVIRRMDAAFQLPEANEGFDEIIVLNNEETN